MKIYKRKFIFSICLLTIIFNIFLFQVPACSETYSVDKAKSMKNVLILNSYITGTSINGFNSNNWFDNIIAGIKSEFKDNSENVNLNVEYMDSEYNSSDEYYSILYNLYKYKFNNTKFDTIIALDNNATDFLIKYGNDLFPNTPVVFSGIDQSKQSLMNDHPLFTGIYRSEDFKSTFNIALTLHPNTKHFFIILDKTSLGLTFKKKANELVYLYKDKLDFSFCDDENIEAVKEKIDALPNDTVILTSADFNDSNGVPIPANEVNNILFKDCPLPVYSPRYTYLNNGIVGGMLTDGTNLGMNLAKITSRILNGESPSNISADIDTSHNYVFDFKQLERFNINMLSLPKDSKIINMATIDFSLSRSVMVCFISIFILTLILIIIFLLTVIRKLKLTKKLLLDNENLLNTIINSTPDIICFKDPNGRVLQANNSILDLLNIKKDDYKFKRFNELINSSSITVEDCTNFEIYDAKSWEHNDVYRTEEIIPYEKEDTYKTYDIIRIPLFNENRTRRGLILIGRDITEHKANEANKKIINELRYYDKLRLEFFTNLSHELRTPLNVIFSSLQVINGTLNNSNNTQIDSNKITKYTNIMKQNCYRLIRLVNNFIDINKIESGYFSLQLQNADIVNIVESIVLSVADYIESKGISIIFDTEVEENIISCDPNMIERIILNLLSNAIKFTPAGGSIEVNIYYRNDNILISVKDTGIGIPVERQDAIFERFVQVDKSLSRNREGSGIGLSLVKSLVELHKGDITLVSKPNEGSKFIIRFPAEPLDHHNIPITNHNLNQNKTEVIKIEFSDIYG